MIKPWSKKDIAAIANSAECSRRHAERTGPDVLAAVISSYRGLAHWRRRNSEDKRQTAAHYRARFDDEATGERFDRLAIESDREAIAFDRVADRLEAGDLPPGVFRDDEADLIRSSS
jgi:hypothetical protein